LSPSGIGTVLRFLTFLFKEGKAYRTINVCRSMLSGTLDKIDGSDIGKHPRVMRLMRGIFNQNPPRPRYTSMWDVDVVLGYVSSLGENHGLSLSALSYKMVLLLALTSFFRVSELASIVRDSVAISPQGARLAVNRVMKQQRSGSLHVLSIARLQSNLTLCPVACLERYIVLTDPFRKGSLSGTLFLSIRSPHGPIGASTIGHWIKKFLSSAGVDISIYSAHSTRGAAASKASSSGVPVERILSAGRWASESVFSRHYRREPESTNVADAVLRPIIS